MDVTINIKKPNQIVLEQIQIKKRISINDNVYEYPISYLRKPLVIQTPIVHIPYTTYKIGSKITFDFFFLNLKVDKDMDNLKTFVKAINKLCKAKIAEDSKPKKIPKTNKTQKLFTIKPKEFISNIKTLKPCFGNKSEKMRVNCYDNIHIFDEYRKPLKLDSLKSKTYLKLLLSPVKIWIHREKYGIYWEVLQIKIYPKAVLNSYMFLDDDKEELKKQNLLSSHPEYRKYFDMMKKGVPKQAVINKMTMDGKDPGILDNPKSSLTSISLLPPPPPPPPLLNTKLSRIDTSKVGINNSQTNKSLMFNELINTVKMGKKNRQSTTVFQNLEEQSKERARNSSCTSKHGNYNPSLDEILTRRNTLRKTK